ncbi:hypothetical protein NDU88_005202 [Pleurodeles waltl]|uniref:Uncharacterized protein n=1 Tax=Pleurodeles waltl TaxID=8319 RepID=A0AAV7MDX0_PLEWA|nr:hypothetical protein NDU88_005202 [Pleurodeles waltl]
MDLRCCALKGVGPRPHLAPGAACSPIRDRGLNLAASSRFPVHAGPPESAGGRHRGRGRARVVPPAPAAHRLRLEMGSRPVRRVLALPADRVVGSRQPRAALVPQESAPGPRPHPCSLARPRWSSHTTLGVRPPAPARTGSGLKSAPPELNS